MAGVFDRLPLEGKPLKHPLSFLLFQLNFAKTIAKGKKIAYNIFNYTIL